MCKGEIEQNDGKNNKPKIEPEETQNDDNNNEPKTITKHFHSINFCTWTHVNWNEVRLLLFSVLFSSFFVPLKENFYSISLFFFERKREINATLSTTPKPDRCNTENCRMDLCFIILNYQENAAVEWIAAKAAAAAAIQHNQLVALWNITDNVIIMCGRIWMR